MNDDNFTCLNNWFVNAVIYNYCIVCSADTDFEFVPPMAFMCSFGNTCSVETLNDCLCAVQSINDTNLHAGLASLPLCLQFIACTFHLVSLVAM